MWDFAKRRERQERAGNNVDEIALRAVYHRNSAPTDPYWPSIHVEWMMAGLKPHTDNGKRTRKCLGPEEGKLP